MEALYLTIAKGVLLGNLMTIALLGLGWLLADHIYRRTR